MTTPFALLFRTAHEPLLPVRAGIQKRELVLGSGLKADEIFFEENAATTGHAHDLEQAAYTVSGEFEVTLGTDRRRLGPGDAYAIPAGTDHAVRCLKQGSYLLITARGASDGHQHAHVDSQHGHDDHEHGDTPHEHGHEHAGLHGGGE